MIGAVLAAGCSPGSDPDSDTPGEATPQEQPGEETPAGSPTPVPGPTTVLASVTGELPGLRLDVNDLSRSGPDIVTLTFTLTNEGAEGVGFALDEFVGEEILLGAEGAARGFSFLGAYLVDEAGNNRHLVLVDTEGICVCSQTGDGLDPGQSARYFAKFPAPPETAEAMTVVIPRFDSVEDVPIAR
jgi:hypothetical protein